MWNTTRYQIFFLASMVVQFLALSTRGHTMNFSYGQDFNYQVQNEQQIEEDKEGTPQGLNKHDHHPYLETNPQIHKLGQEVEEYEQVVSRRPKQVHIQEDQEVVSSRPIQRQIHQQEVHQEKEHLEEPPYFDASMSHTYTAFLGRSASLTCIVHDVPTDNSVSWIRDRDLRILTVGRYTYTTDLRFEALHHPGSSEWTMRIKTVQPRDEGNYECQIATKPIKSFNVFLKVVEPTVEILGSPDIYVNIGSMINLTCIIYNAPSPPKHIRWYHYNKSISYTSSRGGVTVVEERGETTTSCLLLQKASPSDSGPYKCHPHGMQPVMFTVYVIDGAKPAAQSYSAMNQADCKTPSLKSLIALIVLAILG